MENGFMADLGLRNGDGSWNSGNLSLLALLAGSSILANNRPGASFGEAMGGGLLGALQGYSGLQQTSAINQYRKAQLTEAQRKAQAAADAKANLGKVVETLPESQRAAALAFPDEFGKAYTGAMFPKPEASPELSRLIAARDALPPDHPNRKVYDDAIAKASTHQPATSVTVQTGGTVGKTFAEGIGKNFTAQQEKALKAAEAIPLVHQARAALDTGAGIIAGTGADWRLGLARALNTAGATDDERVANTAEYLRSVGSQIGAIAREVGGVQLSEGDRKLAERLAGGDISLTEAELRRILDVSEKAFRDSIRSANFRAESFRKAQPDAAKELGSLLDVPMPEAYKPPEKGALPASAPAAAPKYKVGDTATGPGGKKLRFNGRTWEPVNGR